MVWNTKIKSGTILEIRTCKMEKSVVEIKH